MDGKVARGRRVFRDRMVLVLLGALLAVNGWPGLSPLFGQGRAPQVPGRQAATRAPLVASKKPATSSSSKLKVLAVVNQEQITRQELAREVLRRYGDEVLESLINKKLILQACQQRQIVVTNKDVEDEIGRIASRFSLSVDRWLAMLQSDRDISPDKYRRDIVWPTLALRKLAAGHITVTKEELQQAFEREYGPRVKVRMIMVSNKEQADKLRSQAAANPAKFGDLAKEFSEDRNSASARGLVPAIRKHSGELSVEKAAFALSEGEVSQVIPLANQYFIIKCEKRVAPVYVAERLRADANRRLSDRIVDSKLRNASTSLFQELQDSAKVIIAFSDPELKKQMPGVAATINAEPITIQQLAEECITRYGAEVLDGEINRKILMQELAKQKKQVLPKQIDQEIARAADSYGYLTKDGKPNVAAWLKDVTEKDGATVDLYVRDAVWPTVALKQLVDSKVTVSEKDLKLGFESNYGSRVEILAIVLGDQRQATRVWEMARNNPTDAYFGQLAQQYSIEPVSRSNRGKVPPVRRHGGRPHIEQEAFALKKGELSGVVALGDKFVIMRCLGQTNPVVTNFEAVKAELHKDILEKKMRMAMAREYDRLKEKAEVINFLRPAANLKGYQASQSSAPKF